MPVRWPQSSFLVRAAAPTVFAESRLLTTTITSVCVWFIFFFKAVLCSSILALSCLGWRRVSKFYRITASQLDHGNWWRWWTSVVKIYDLILHWTQGSNMHVLTNVSSDKPLFFTYNNIIRSNWLTFVFSKVTYLGLEQRTTALPSKYSYLADALYRPTASWPLVRRKHGLNPTFHWCLMLMYFTFLSPRKENYIHFHSVRHSAAVLNTWIHKN